MTATFIARPPRNGLRVRKEGDTVVAHLLDDSDLGYAALALFIPVARTRPDGPLQVLTGKDASKTFPSDTLRQHAIAVELPKPDRDDVRDPTRTGSYIVSFELAPHFQADSFLALLVYFSRLPTNFAETQNSDPFDYVQSVYVAFAAQPETERSADLAGPALDKRDLAPGVISALAANASNDAVTFALSSCLYPCDILDHMPRGRGEVEGPADEALLRLGRVLDGLHKPDPRAGIPELFIMAGDQVYVDAT